MFIKLWILFILLSYTLQAIKYYNEIKLFICTLSI